MLFRVFCIVSVQDLYALEKFQSTWIRGAQHLLNYILVLIYKVYTRCSRVKGIGLWSASNALMVNFSQLNNFSFYDSFDESRTVYLV